MNTINLNTSSTGHLQNDAINSAASLLVSENAPKVVAITSARSQTGKTFVALRVAKSLANMGRKVLLVDADLAGSTLLTQYGAKVQSGKSFGDYLAGKAEMNEVVYKLADSTAVVAPSLGNASLPMPFITSARFAEFIAKAKGEYDTIIVDTPAMNLNVEAVEIARQADGAYIVARQGDVVASEINAIQARLKLVGCGVIGLILNRISLTKPSEKHYYLNDFYARAKDRLSQRKRQ